MAQDNFDIDLIPNDFSISSTEIFEADSNMDTLFTDEHLLDDVQNIEDKTPTDAVPPKKSVKEEMMEVLLKEEQEALAITPATEKIEEEEKQENKQDEEEKEEGEDNTFEILSKNLFDLGVFNKYEGDEDEKITTPEDFRDRFIKEVNLQANSQISNFILDKHGEEGMAMFNAIFANGVSPKEFLSRYSEIEDVASLDIKQESVQEKVYKAYYKELGWDDAKIDSRLQKLKDYGDLEEEAVLVHEKLIESKQAKLAQLEASKKQEEAQKIQYKETYNNTVGTILTDKLKAKDFDGIPVTDKIAREVHENLVAEKYKLPTGEKLTEFDKMIMELKRPENYEKKVKLALLMHMDFDLSKVKVKQASDKNTKLFEGLATKEKIAKRTNPEGPTNFSKFL